MGKSRTGLLIAGAAVVGVSGVLVFTNPTRSQYVDYAVDRLEDYAKQELCDSSSSDLGRFLGGSCETLIQLGRGPAREVIATHTEHQNFGLFSLYRTDLDLAELAPQSLFEEPLPSYHVEAIGIFQQIVIYEAEEQ